MERRGYLNLEPVTFVVTYAASLPVGNAESSRPAVLVYPGSSEPASDPTRALRAGLLRPDLVFVITFREIVPRT